MPYGELLVEGSSVDLAYRFSAKETDRETGLSYFGARYYDPSVAVWLGADPLWEAYVGMNPYNYCAGNPMGLMDVDGEAIYQAEDGSESYMIVDDKTAARYGDIYKHENGTTYKKVSDGYDIDNIKKVMDKANEPKRNEQTAGMLIFGMSDREDRSVNDRAKHQDKSVDSSDLNGGWNISNYSIIGWLKSLFSSKKEVNSENLPEVQEEQKPQNRIEKKSIITNHIVGEGKDGWPIYVSDTMEIDNYYDSNETLFKSDTVKKIHSISSNNRKRK